MAVNQYPQGSIGHPLAVEAVTPSDVADLPFAGRAIMLPTEGAVRITDLAGNTITFASGDLAATVKYDMPIAKVHETGTTSGLKIYVWMDK